MAISATETLPLIHTKLYKPRIAEGLIPRPRLLELLDRGREQPLTLVVAPAGYGKTSQVAAWLEASDWPSTWLSLDEQDSDLNLFLCYIIAAIQSIFPDACRETAALVETAAELPIQVLSRTLVNELVQIKKDFLLVLDDYHLVHEMAVHDLMTEILRHPPRALPSGGRSLRSNRSGGARPPEPAP